jgi:hypothetical protein
MVVAVRYLMVTGNEPFDPPTTDVKWRMTKVDSPGWNIIDIIWRA